MGELSLRFPPLASSRPMLLAPQPLHRPLGLAETVAKPCSPPMQPRCSDSKTAVDIGL